jgi:hypothetical protein
MRLQRCFLCTISTINEVGLYKTILHRAAEEYCLLRFIARGKRCSLLLIFHKLWNNKSHSKKARRLLQLLHSGIIVYHNDY